MYLPEQNYSRRTRIGRFLRVLTCMVCRIVDQFCVKSLSAFSIVKRYSNCFQSRTEKRFVPRGLARTGQKGGGGAHLGCEHFTRTTAPPEPRGRTSNLCILRVRSQSQGGCLSPLSSPWLRTWKRNAYVLYPLWQWQTLMISHCVKRPMYIGYLIHL